MVFNSILFTGIITNYICSSITERAVIREQEHVLSEPSSHQDEIPFVRILVIHIKTDLFNNLTGMMILANTAAVHLKARQHRRATLVLKAPLVTVSRYLPNPLLNL